MPHDGRIARDENIHLAAYFSLGIPPELVELNTATETIREENRLSLGVSGVLN